jgi:hypothetical protein
VNERRLRFTGALRAGAGRGTRLAGVEKPPIDPAKLLATWMEWERGETPPGQVMANLKTGGMKELLEELTSQLQAAD